MVRGGILEVLKIPPVAIKATKKTTVIPISQISIELRGAALLAWKTRTRIKARATREIILCIDERITL